MDRNRLRYRIREPGGNATAHPLTRARLNDHDSAREISWEVATSLASKCNPDARFQRGGSGFRKACYRARFARPVGSIRAKLSPPDRLICPTGCSGSSAVQPLFQKNFPSRLTQINSISLDVPSLRGALARSSRTRDGMRWTRQRQAREGIAGRVSRERSQRADEQRWRGRRSRVVLTPRRRRQVQRRQVGPTGRGQNHIRWTTVTNKPDHRGEHEVSR
jgi:hypothetical protein